METRYYVYGLGYDENDCVTDYSQYFGDFDTYDEAFELFEELQNRSPESFFENAPKLYQLVIQIEECEEDEDDESTECVDVYDEWWFKNPNYNETMK